MHKIVQLKRNGPGIEGGAVAMAEAQVAVAVVVKIMVVAKAAMMQAVQEISITQRLKVTKLTVWEIVSVQCRTNCQQKFFVVLKMTHQNSRTMMVVIQRKRTFQPIWQVTCRKHIPKS